MVDRIPNKVCGIFLFYRRTINKRNVIGLAICAMQGNAVGWNKMSADAVNIWVHKDR